MKKLIIVASVAIVTLFACQKTELLTPKNSSENIALSEGLNSNTTSSAFNIELKSNNVVNGSNFEWVWKVTNGSFGKDISHFSFTNFNICEDIKLKDALVGAAYSTDGINWTTSTVAWERDPSINGAGRNQDCFGGDVMKIDAGQSMIYYKLILNEEFGVGDNNSNGYWKSATSCGLISYDGPTCLPEEEKCYAYTESETAWGAGTRYVTKGNWATYSTASALATGVTLYAGKTTDIGTAKLTSGVITITLKNGWELVPNTDAVKIQGYNSTPAAKNPAPGQFSTYKGSSLTPSVASFTYYGIHLDVRQKYEVDCPE
jgi:hypothetical protein